MKCPNWQFYGCPHHTNPETPIDPNDSKSIADASGVVHVFHRKCMNDVLSGWSGAPVSNHFVETHKNWLWDCLSENFKAVGIDLPTISG